MNNQKDMESHLDETQKENKNNTVHASDLHFERVENVDENIQPSHPIIDGPSVTTRENGESAPVPVSDGPKKRLSTKEKKKMFRKNSRKLFQKLKYFSSTRAMAKRISSKRLLAKFEYIFNNRTMEKKRKISKYRASRRLVSKQLQQETENKTIFIKDDNDVQPNVSMTGPDQVPNRPCTLQDCEVIIISENEDDDNQQPTCSTTERGISRPEKTRLHSSINEQRTVCLAGDSEELRGEIVYFDGEMPPLVRLSPQINVNPNVIDLTSDDNEIPDVVIIQDQDPNVDDDDGDGEPMEIDEIDLLRIFYPFLIQHPDVELPVPRVVMELREFFGIAMTVRTLRPMLLPGIQPPASRLPLPTPMDRIEQLPSSDKREVKETRLKNLIRDTVVEYAYLYHPNCIIDMLVSRIRHCNFLRDTDRAWLTPDGSDIRELLMWLTYSMSNIHLNIIPLMACLMITFRMSVQTARLSNRQTYLKFKMFINVIKRCFATRDPQFWRTWISTENFLCGCYYVDHVLFSRLPEYKSMERHIKWWFKSPMMKWYLRMPSYHVPLPEYENRVPVRRISFRSLTPPLSDPTKEKFDKCVQVNIESDPHFPSTSGLAQ